MLTAALLLVALAHVSHSSFSRMACNPLYPWETGDFWPQPDLAGMKARLALLRGRQTG
jgi:hypothetical protein